MSERLGLARSTVSRILIALEAERLVAAVGPRGPYRLGPEITRMAASVRRSTILEVHPFLEELSRELDETVDLSVLDGTVATFIDQVVAPQRLRAVSAVGDSFPLHCCANGKALLAVLPDTYIAEHLPATLARFTANTITTPGALRREIETVRRAGVAFDREEHTTGISAVGAVLGDFGTERLAVSVPVPTQRFLGRQDELAHVLRGWVERVDGALRTAAG